MTAVVVRLDVVDVDGRGNSRHLVEISYVAPQVRVVGQPANVALEVTDIHWVEAHQRGKEAPVCFGNSVARQVAARCESFFNLVECVEQGNDRFIIGFLTASEAGAIYAVVDVG